MLRRSYYYYYCGVRLSRIFLITCILLFYFPSVPGDVAIDVVCLLESSVFPVDLYDQVLERISNNTLSSSTTFSADLITGAEAKMKYFTSSSAVIRRFELLHITRARSVILTTNGNGSSVVGKLRLELIRSVADGVGMCGIDTVIDTAASSPHPFDPLQQWFMTMPALVAPIALGGWLLTLMSCLVCWLCVCCTTRNVAVAQVSYVDSFPPPPVMTGVTVSPTTPLLKLPPPVVDGKVDPSTNPKKKGNSFFNSELPPLLLYSPPPPPPSQPLHFSSLPSISIDFQHQSSRHLSLRIPSFA